MGFVVVRDFRRNNAALDLGVGKMDFGELFRPAHHGAFHQDAVIDALLCVQMLGHLPRTSFAQAGRTGFDQGTVHRRHPRGWRSFAGRVGKDMQPRQIALINQLEGVVEHRFGFGREARDNIGAKGHIRP